MLGDGEFMTCLDKGLGVALLLSVGFVSLPTKVSALPLTLNDDYRGALPSYSASTPYPDVIGNTSVFDIDQAIVSNSGADLIIKLETNFAGKADGTPDAPDYGAVYGDLFLGNYIPGAGGSDNIIPNSVNVATENYVNDKDRFQLALDVPTTTGSSNVDLVKLDGVNLGSDVELSDDFFGSTGLGYRQGHAIETISSDVVGSGSFTIGSGYLEFTIKNFFTDADIEAAISPNDGFIFSWAMSCANDVFYGIIDNPGEIGAVPLPGGLIMLLSGLLGLGWLGRARAKQA